MKEYLIGTEVYERKPPYHPGEDSIVRSEARRLRRKLKEYYESDGKDDPVLIYYRPGSYVPIFSFRELFSERQGIRVAVLPFVDASGRTWAVAEDKAVELQEQLDRGDTPKPIIVKGPQPTIGECIDTFISAKKSENISARRVKKLRHQFNQFEAFMSARSKVFPSLITSADVIEFRAGWERAWPSATTRQNAQQNIRSFLRTRCRENLNDLLAALKTIRLSKVDKERLEPKPFTEKEIKVLFAQIPKTFPAEKVAVVTLLVKFMIATGVAIRDTVQLDRHRHLQDGWLRFDRQKTGRSVVQQLDPTLYAELMEGEGKYVFWDGKYQVTSEVTTWQDDLRLLMQNAGLWIEGNTTHRFRDTAVDFWLGEGCELTEVAAMLGDTLAVAQRHYANLASKRMQERLKNVPVRSWANPRRARMSC